MARFRSRREQNEIIARIRKDLTKGIEQARLTDRWE